MSLWMVLQMAQSDLQHSSVPLVYGGSQHMGPSALAIIVYKTAYPKPDAQPFAGGQCPWLKVREAPRHPESFPPPLTQDLKGPVPGSHL